MTNTIGADDVRRFVVEYLSEMAQRFGVKDLNLDDDTHLLEIGVMDSIGFIELVLATEERFGLALDLDREDPAEFTTLAGFVRTVAGAARR